MLEFAQNKAITKCQQRDKRWVRKRRMSLYVFVSKVLLSKMVRLVSIQIGRSDLVLTKEELQLYFRFKVKLSRTRNWGKYASIKKLLLLAILRYWVQKFPFWKLNALTVTKTKCRINCGIPRHLFASHWIRIASIVIYLVLQSTPTHVTSGPGGVF